MTDTTPAPIGAPVPRYKIGYRSDEWGERSSTPGGIPDPAGAWVRYDDHAAALASAAPAAGVRPCYDFRGDTPSLVRAITAFLALDAKGALVPHGLCANTRTLLTAAASRLAAPTTQPAPVAQRDALPREDFAWMVVQEACETEPADEDDPECIRILRIDLKSAVLAAFLRLDAARSQAKEGGA